MQNQNINPIQNQNMSAEASVPEAADRAHPFFSVVMPAFNVESFLEDAVSDILGQTFLDWELIIVDDCSTDGTLQIAKAYDDAYENIHVLTHEKNRGVSEARNTGLSHARGEYMLFLDPDDRYDVELMETVACALHKLAADVVVYGLEEDYYSHDGQIRYAAAHALPTAFFCVDQKAEDNTADSAADAKQSDPAADANGDGVSKQNEGRAEGGIFFGARSMHLAIAELEQETLYGYSWNKAFRRELLMEHDLQFVRYPHIEDIMFNLSVFDYVQSLIVLEDVLYGYRNQGQNRLTDRYQPNYLLLQKKRFEEFLAQQERWGVLTEKTLGQTATAYFRSYLSMISREQSHHTPAKDILIKAEKEQKDPLFLRLRDHLPTEGRLSRIFYVPLAKGQVKTAIRRSRIVTTVREMFPNLFAQIKQYRG